VRNDYGDIRVRFAGDGRIFVHTVIQRLAGPNIGVNVERHGEALAVTLVLLLQGVRSFLARASRDNLASESHPVCRLQQA
jgi:hypothetical protein